MNINSFMESFKKNLLNLFNDNLLFLGLQGSYGRGEAKESSDIDPVIILRQCGKDEILKYRSYIDTLPEKDILCGFVSSIDELRAWESADRAQLILYTKPLYGELTPHCPEITHDDIIRAVQQGACAIHHASSHNILHTRNWSILPELYKSARFTISMKHYLDTGVYVSAFRDLIGVVDDKERKILEARNPDTEEDAFTLLEWASNTMKDMTWKDHGTVEVKTGHMSINTAEVEKLYVRYMPGTTVWDL